SSARRGGARPGRGPRQSAGAARPVALRHLWRPADRAVARDGDGAIVSGSPAATSPYVLASQGPGGGPGAPQRTADQLPRGNAAAIAELGAHQRRPCLDGQARGRLRAAGGSPVRGGQNPAASGGPCRAHRPERFSGQSNQPSGNRLGAAAGIWVEPWAPAQPGRGDGTTG